MEARRRIASALLAYEVEQVSATGQHLYVVAIDVDATVT